MGKFSAEGQEKQHSVQTNLGLSWRLQFCLVELASNPAEPKRIVGNRYQTRQYRSPRDSQYENLLGRKAYLSFRPILLRAWVSDSADLKQQNRIRTL